MSEPPQAKRAGLRDVHDFPTFDKLLSDAQMPNCSDDPLREGTGTECPGGARRYGVSMDFGSVRNGTMPMKVMPSLLIHGFS